MLPMTQLSPDPWVREYVVGKHLLYTACNFEMLIACLRGNMKAMNGNWKLWKIRIEMVLDAKKCQLYLSLKFGPLMARSPTHACITISKDFIQIGWTLAQIHCIFLRRRYTSCRSPCWALIYLQSALAQRVPWQWIQERSTRVEAEGGAALQGRGACWKRERRSESRLHFNDLGTSGMKIIESKHNRAATVICTHTTKTLQSAMQL